MSAFFGVPVNFGKQHLADFLGKVAAFLRKDLHLRYGMCCLVESFYRSITEIAPIPIPYCEILLTARTMDSIFEQTKRKPS